MNSFLKKTLLVFLSIIILFAVIILALWLKPAPSFPHDSPRQLPWTLPDYSAAKTQVSVLSNGQIKIDIEHLPLNNITPAMVAWFYQQLPISTVQLSNKTYPLYHIFHPTEHGIIVIKEPALDGSQGMGVGALVERQEWFGPFNSKGAGRIISFSAKGMVVHPEIMGLQFGEITHSFEATNFGTQYRVSSKIGSELPIIGPILNYYIRNKIFTQPMLKEWLRHQVEEVSSLSFFLANIYGKYHTQTADNHYIISPPAITNVADTSL